MLEVESLVARYGAVEALHGVSLEVGAGEAVAIVGPNGAGKTTLLRTISGLVRAASGSVRIDGRTVGRTAAHRVARLGVSHVPEGRATFWQKRRGGYTSRERSLAFPFLRASDLPPWLEETDAGDNAEFVKMQHWARTVLAPRRKPDEGR